jgi:hypothetical protein
MEVRPLWSTRADWAVLLARVCYRPDSDQIPQRGENIAMVESRMGAVAWAFGHRPVSHPTGSPEAVVRLRFPQNVACGFPALRSSAGVSQHCKSLQLRVRETQLWFQ